MAKVQRTNVVIDVEKLGQAKEISGLKTTREVIDFALARIVGSERALEELTKLRGKIKFNPQYDYKKQR